MDALKWLNFINLHGILQFCWTELSLADASWAALAWDFTLNWMLVSHNQVCFWNAQNSAQGNLNWEESTGQNWTNLHPVEPEQSGAK